MFRQGMIWIAAVVIALSAPAACAAETLESVEAKIAELWEKIDAYRAKMEMASNISQQGMTMESEGSGVIEFMKKGDIAYYRSELKNTMKMGTNVMESELLSVYDGSYLYTQMDMMGRPMVTKMKPEDRMLNTPVSGKQLVEQLHKNFDVELLPEDTVNGQPAYVLKLTQKEDAEGAPKSLPPSFGMSKVYFSKETGLQLRMETLDKDGKPIMSVDYSDFELNPELDASRFTYTPPEGAHVMEIPEGGMMGGMQ